MGGFSAGGNLAFAACQLPILTGRVHGLIGFYPPLDLTEKLEEKLKRRPKEAGTDALASSARFLDWAYVPYGADRSNTLLSPGWARKETLPRHVYLIGAEYGTSYSPTNFLFFSYGNWGLRSCLGSPHDPFILVSQEPRQLRSSQLLHAALEFRALICWADMLCHEANQLAEYLADPELERTNIPALSPLDGWKQGTIRWECARGRFHAFTHVAEWNRQKERDRVKAVDELYYRVGIWLKEEVWADRLLS
jgi:hypothetical protein